MQTYDFDREGDARSFRDRLIRLGWTVSHPWYDNPVARYGQSVTTPPAAPIAGTTGG